MRSSVPRAIKVAGIMTILAVSAFADTACTANSSAAHGSTGTASGSGHSAASSSSTASGPTSRPVATTPVPAPSPGNLTATVPSQVVLTRSPVPLTETERFDGRLTAHITSVRRVDATARLPGETSGAAVDVTIQLHNTSHASVGTDAVEVAVSDAHGNPLVLIETASQRVPDTVAAGASVTGSYVFHLRSGFTNPASVNVSYSTTAAVLVFVGRI